VLKQETTYGYNEIGQQVSPTDANRHTKRFEYDQLGRRVKRVLPAGQFETYSYDTGGSLQSETDFNGKTTSFSYDVIRRLLAKTPNASLNQPTVSFTYIVRKRSFALLLQSTEAAREVTLGGTRKMIKDCFGVCLVSIIGEHQRD
jgi:YD repeat-containing protein